jgi:hypothetical protein
MSDDDTDEASFCSLSCRKQFTDMRQQSSVAVPEANSGVTKPVGDDLVEPVAATADVTSPSTVATDMSATSSPPRKAIKLSICRDPQQGAVAILPGSQPTARLALGDKLLLKHKADGDRDKVSVVKR